MSALGQIDPGQVPWFPADKFDGYLWDNEDCVWVSFIMSKQPGKGHLSALFNEIRKQGKAVKVPTPFAHMTAILKHKGFTPTVEMTDMGACEVWVLQ